MAWRYSWWGVADLGGAAVDPVGLDPAALLAHKQAGQSVAKLAGVGQPGVYGPQGWQQRLKPISCLRQRLSI